MSAPELVTTLVVAAAVVAIAAVLIEHLLIAPRQRVAAEISSIGTAERAEISSADSAAISGSTYALYSLAGDCISRAASRAFDDPGEATTISRGCQADYALAEESLHRDESARRAGRPLPQ